MEKISFRCARNYSFRSLKSSVNHTITIRDAHKNRRQIFCVNRNVFSLDFQIIYFSKYGAPETCVNISFAGEHTN